MSPAPALPPTAADRLATLLADGRIILGLAGPPGSGKSTLAAALADHHAVVEAVDAAQEVAAFTVQQVGAEPPRRDQLSERWQRA